jgi:CheY-like chemotaxis protein
MFLTTTARREAASSYNSWLVPAKEGREFCLPFIVHMEGCQGLLFAGNRGCLRPEALAAALEFVTSSIVCRGMLIPYRAGSSAMANILVVDDDPVMQMTVRLLLERAGHSVIVADDGRKGLAEFKTGHFDLVFLDIFMPTMDGLETMKLVRELRPSTPIIAMSGRPVMPDSGSEPDFLAMATRLGAVPSLPKPFRPAALLATLADCLAAAREPSAQPAPDSDVASRH